MTQRARCGARQENKIQSSSSTGREFVSASLLAYGEQLDVEPQVLSVDGLFELDQETGAAAGHLFPLTDQVGRVGLERGVPDTRDDGRRILCLSVEPLSEFGGGRELPVDSNGHGPHRSKQEPGLDCRVS